MQLCMFRLGSSEQQCPSEEAEAGYNAGEQQHDHQIAHNVAGGELGDAQRRQRPEGIMFVHWSPQAMAIAMRPASMPMSAPAGIMMGPCTAHWPPPEGTKKFTIPAARKDSMGKVTLVEMLTKNSEMTLARDTFCSLEATIRPIMPA